ncbi:hypothetical protein ACH4ND_12755 [Streptomyces sp. NPDC017179]|uniref:hypothetical protein n=1 Tax=Streptomyces sp. NPDC017179 TaxID=3364979 RepID=UPI0037AB7FE0
MGAISQCSPKLAAPTETGAAPPAGPAIALAALHRLALHPSSRRLRDCGAPLAAPLGLPPTGGARTPTAVPHLQRVSRAA